MNDSPEVWNFSEQRHRKSAEFCTILSWSASYYSQFPVMTFPELLQWRNWWKYTLVNFLAKTAPESCVGLPKRSKFDWPSVNHLTSNSLSVWLQPTVTGCPASSPSWHWVLDPDCLLSKLSSSNVYLHCCSNIKIDFLVWRQTSGHWTHAGTAPDPARYI